MRLPSALTPLATLTLFAGAALAQPKAAAPATAKPGSAAPTPAPTAPAGGATSDNPTGGPEAGAASVKVERGAGGKKVYRITDVIKIEGKIQKPEAFYVLQKSSINYDWQELKQDFIPKILDSVAKAPF